MNIDPFLRFLGVPESAPPAALLGLPEGPIDRVSVETALHERLEQIYRHPAGNSDEAERVRRRLREVAAALVRQMIDEASGAREPTAVISAASRARAGVKVRSHPPGGATTTFDRDERSQALLQLTEFDRNALAVLVGCGGWNARSRALLVALAAAYGVSAHGLKTVITGLNEYARAGGAHLGVEAITGGGGHVAAPAFASTAGGEPHPSWAQRLAPELREGDAWSTFKLSLLFGLVTLVLAVFLLRLALVGQDADGPVPLPPAVVETRPSPRVPIGESASSADEARLAHFKPLPTFLGHGLPLPATEAADACARLPQHLDLNARKLAITDEPSEQVFRDWDISINTIASGWVLVDDSTRRAIDRAIEDVLYEASDAPSVGDRLLDALFPPSDRLSEPLDLWRGAWMTGTLGWIAGSRSVSPSVSEQACIALSVALDRADVDGLLDREAAADAWLEKVTVRLVDVLEFDDRIYDFWEMWLSAHRRLGEGDRFNRAIMSAIERILRSRTELSRPGPSVNVLGRLLMEADFQSSAVVRDRMIAFFEGQEPVGDAALWVVTSLLAQMDAAPWFGEGLVMARAGGARFRSRIRDRIAAAWPQLPRHLEGDLAESGHGIRVDAHGGLRWRAMTDRLARPSPDETDERLAHYLLTASRLNEAAALLAAGRTEAALALMELIEPDLAPRGNDQARRSRDLQTLPIRVTPPKSRHPDHARTPPGSGPLAPGRGSGAVRRGQVIAPSDDWARQYAEVRRNTEAKLNLLNALRNRAGTDLEPVDAEVFVGEVYRGSPQEVRELARSILLDQFAHGPNVAMGLLDHFDSSPRNEDISEVIGALTGRLLVPSRSESWRLQARLALAQHALSLHHNGHGRIDRLVEQLTNSYADRISALQHQSLLSGALALPQEAVEVLAELWQERGRSVIATDPVPADLAALARGRQTRRGLAEGPIQVMVADLVSVLDLMAYTVVAEQPGVKGRVLEVLDQCAQRRRDAAHVLRQAVDVEHAIAELWRLRLWIPGDARSTEEHGS